MQTKTVLLELLAVGGIGLLIPWVLLMKTAYQEALSSSEKKGFKESKPLLLLGVIAGLLMVCGFAPFFGWFRPWYLVLPCTLVIISALHWVFTWISTRTVRARIGHLQHSDRGVRAAAAQTLGQLRNRRAVKPLIRALDDTSVRTEAAEALGCLGDASALDHLLPLLEDEKQDARRRDAGSFGRGSSAREQAMTMRKTAVVALGKLRDPRAIDPLIELLGSNDRDLRKSAAAALQVLGETKWTQLVQGDYGNDDFARLGACGDPRARRPLAKAVQIGITEAVEPLVKLGGEAVVETLTAAMNNNPNPQVKIASAHALGTIGDPRTVQVLIDSMKINEDPQVKVASVQALGKIKEPRVVQALIASLYGEVAIIRQMAAQTLGGLGDPRALEPLRSLLSDSNVGIRVAAASALMQLGEDKWKKAVRGDSDDLARLKSLGHPVPFVPLIEVLKNTAVDPLTASSVAETLGKLRDPASVDPLMEVLRSKSANLRRVAAIALGWIGDRRAVLPLLEVMAERSDSSNVYIGDVVSSLERIGDERAASALNQHWESTAKDLAEKATKFLVHDYEKEKKAEAKRALLAMGSKAVPALIGLLSVWRSQYEQTDLLTLLGELGDSRAVAPLRNFLSDSEGMVRRSAAVALGRLAEAIGNVVCSLLL